MNTKITTAIWVACGMAAPGLVHAQAPVNGSQAQAGTLQEIVVTAQKRRENLEDIPVSAAVVAAGSLRQANAGDITDLNNMVPSVDLNGTINGRVPIGMRGVSSNANEATVGLSSGVAIMVDGVPVPSDSYDGNQLDDVERVEVLKGPQGTLGGRTAAAGVINLVTRGPSRHFTGSASATATSDHEYRGNLFLAGPIADDLQFSLAAYGNKRQYPITNIATGQKTTQRTNGVRAKLRFEASDDLDAMLMAHFDEARSEGFNFVYTYVTPGASLLAGTANPNPFPPPVQPVLSQSTLLAGITPSWTNLSYNSPVYQAGSLVKDADASFVVHYHTHGLDFTSTTAYQHETQVNIQDLFAVATYFSNDLRSAFQNFFLNILQLPGIPPGTPASWADFNNTQTQREGVRQVSEEFKVVSPADLPVSYVAGLFYSDTVVGLWETRTFTPAAVDYFVRPETKTYDIYGRATWKITPKDSLVAGLRYNSDHLSYFENELTYATVPGAPPFGPLTSSGSNTSGAMVGDVSFQHQLAPTSMVYATYSRGYAPRAYNTALALSSSATQQPVGQEHVDDFELGSKGTYFGEHLSFNLALFDTIYRNYQIQSYSSLPGYTAPPLILENAAKAETRGVETDLAYKPSARTMFTFNAAFIDAKFLNYANAPCWGGTAGAPQEGAACVNNVQNVSGDTMPNSPKFKGVLGLEHRVPLPSTRLDLTFGGTYAYRTRAQMLPDQNPQAIQGAFGLLNAHVGIESRDGVYSVTAFANNLTNHRYYADVEDFWTGPWASNAVVAQPARDASRYFGIRMHVNF